MYMYKYMCMCMFFALLLLSKKYCLYLSYVALLTRFILGLLILIKLNINYV